MQKTGVAQISLSRYYKRNEEYSEILSTPGPKIPVCVYTRFTQTSLTIFQKL
jgi:hypothetical protein